MTCEGESGTVALVTVTCQEFAAVPAHVPLAKKL